MIHEFCQGQKEKTLFMFCGPCYAGKSHWYKEGADKTRPHVVLSTDTWLTEFAHQKDISYQKAFERHYEEAVAYLKENLDRAIDLGINVYWDQTNLTVKSRARKLEFFPDDWCKKAIVCTVGLETLLWRRQTCKTYHRRHEVPEFEVRRQHGSFELPTLEEGFDDIFPPWFKLENPLGISAR